ncbi:MAG: polysaccharide biosynthesis/export family protein [Pseudomonadota bacterium]
MSVARLGVFCALILVAGCSALPSSGPSTGALLDAPTPLLVIEADRDVIAALSKRSSFGQGDRIEAEGDGADLKIAVGDRVTVSIYETLAGDPVTGLFNGSKVPEQTVSRKGRIFIPYIGRVKAAGRTRDAVAAEIARRLGTRTLDPSVLVTVEKRLSNAVSVIGDATEGGLAVLEPGAERLLDAVAQMGGVTVPAHEATISLTRKGRTWRTPFSEILRDPVQNVRLAPGDLVAVTHEARSFIAAGANGRSGLFPFRPGHTTLAEGLAQAGGLRDDRADPSGIFVLRYEPRGFVTALYGSAPVDGLEVPTVYRFDFRQPEQLFLARRFMLRDDDIVFISNARTVQIQKFLDLFRTTLSTGTQAASAGTF